MNQERVTRALAPAVGQKEAAHAADQDFLPILLLEAEGNMMLVGLAVDKQEWGRVKFHPSAAFLIIDAYQRLVEADEHYVVPDGGLANDPESKELICVGVDHDGANQEVRTYCVDDDGSLQWDDPFIVDDAAFNGPMMDVLRGVLR